MKKFILSAIIMVLLVSCKKDLLPTPVAMKAIVSNPIVLMVQKNVNLLWFPQVNMLRQDDTSARANKPYIILATGNSIIRGWYNMYTTLPAYPMLNRAFGGSTWDDLYNFKEDIIFSHPNRKQSVYYEGDNEVIMGWHSDRIFRSAIRVIEADRANKPLNSIIVMGMRPSPKVWNLGKDSIVRNYNNLLKNYVAARVNTKYVDLYSIHIGADGRPILLLYVTDLLHPNWYGYEAIRKALAPYLIVQPLINTGGLTFYRPRTMLYRRAA